MRRPHALALALAAALAACTPAGPEPVPEPVTVEFHNATSHELVLFHSRRGTERLLRTVGPHASTTFTLEGGVGGLAARVSDATSRRVQLRRERMGSGPDARYRVEATIAWAGGA